MLETLGEEFRAKRLRRQTYQALLDALRPVIGDDLYDTYKLVAIPLSDSALDTIGEIAAGEIHSIDEIQDESVIEWLADFGKNSPQEQPPSLLRPRPQMRTDGAVGEGDRGRRGM
jgi:hypothetical protein